ncbi:monovalent cation:proton antiporter-2 (CPA2) family protein [Asticcacaulis sp. YBE204]|uniref:monovalent cation:proton antiporter-2 (CPA2) family protein n=1 Tax=Asticcacaulis sp. YBE204 TaxID=1282363 RepID=UPI0003C3ECCC|nr:monovalent cation:proton antiporter-2 (CPA2) family protein [Asticcacaulis sp. YBE204]ESQ78996.1 potassium transporter [Asticcacaulis sp. YBE204]
MDTGLLLNVFVFLAAACLVVPLAARFKLGAVLGYLVAGVIIGPSGFGFIDRVTSTMHFAEFGVVMMMFLIGLELEPPLLWRLRKTIVGLGGLQVVLSSAALMLAAMAFGFNWQTSLAIGMALSMSSTALVLQMLEERNLMRTQVGEASFSVLLFQDIAVIPILIIIPLLAAGGHGASAHGASLVADLPVWAQAVAGLATILLVVAVGQLLSRYFLPRIAKTNLREVFTATSLGLVVGVTILMQMVGVSPALGAFLGGVVLANSPYKTTIETDIQPFKGLLLGLFFISVGMGMDVDRLLTQPLQLLGAVVGLMAIKALIIWVVALRFDLRGMVGMGLALSLAQGGEFAFVLFQLSGQLGLLEPDTRRFLTLVVAISIGVTPICLELFNRFVVPKFMSVLPDRDPDTIEERNSVIVAGFGRFGQIVGRFLVSQGVKVTILEKNPDQIELLQKFGTKGYFGDATRLDVLRAAGAETAQMLIIAIDDADGAVQIVHHAREHFPKLKLYARARNRRHAYELDRAGVDYYHRETLDSSLALAREAMISMGYSKAVIDRKAQQFLAHDIVTLRKSFAFFDSEPDLVNFSRLSQKELSRILTDDAVDSDAR